MGSNGYFNVILKVQIKILKSMCDIRKKSYLKVDE